MRQLGLALLLATAGISVGAAAQAPAPWTAQGKWVVEFADQQCSASRAFSQGGSKLTVVVIPTAASDEARLWLATADPRARLDRAKIMVGGQPLEVEGMFLKGTSANGERVYVRAMTADEYARLLSSGKLEVGSPSLNASLALSSVAAVGKLLDQCNADLLKQWGYGAEVAELSAPAKPSREAASYVSVNDYPQQAIEDGASGSARVLVAVGPDGRSKACRVLQSAGHKALDEATCMVFKRVRYTPARNKAGQAVEAPFVGELSWVQS